MAQKVTTMTERDTSPSRDGADVTEPVLGDGSIAYTPGTSDRKSSTSIFDHCNYIITCTRQTNSSQTTTATRVYDAFGNLESTTGTPQSRFGFVGGQGYQEDGDSGLTLLGHRYFDPAIGRFLTRDPSQQGRNWFVYCEKNPLISIDDDGLDNKNMVNKANAILADIDGYDNANNDPNWPNLHGGTCNKNTEYGVFVGRVAKVHDPNFRVPQRCS